MADSLFKDNTPFEIPATPPKAPAVTGIPKILDAMQCNGSPSSLIENDESRLSFMIRLPVHAEARRFRLL